MTATISSVQHIAGYCFKSLEGDANSPNNRLLPYRDALQRTGCESIEATVRTVRLLWSGTLLRMGDHTSPKRVMSGDLENAG